MRKSLMVTAAFLLVLSACTDTPVQPVDRDPVAAFGASEGMLDFFFPGVWACDEPVDVSGVFHPVTQINVSNSGQVNVKFHINAKGKGVGVFSGAKYEWNDNLKTSENFDANDGAPYVFSDYRYLRLVGQGPAANYQGRFHFHVTFDANGVLRAEHSNFGVALNGARPQPDEPGVTLGAPGR